MRAQSFLLLVLGDDLVVEKPLAWFTLCFERAGGGLEDGRAPLGLVVGESDLYTTPPCVIPPADPAPGRGGGCPMHVG